MKILFICAMVLMVYGARDTAPSGYCVLPDKDITYQIVKIARSMLNKPLGTCTPFNIGEKNYQGCVEYHWDEVKGKHIGVTVYTECKPK